MVIPPSPGGLHRRGAAGGHDERSVTARWWGRHGPVRRARWRPCRGAMRADGVERSCRPLPRRPVRHRTVRPSGRRNPLGRGAAATGRARPRRCLDRWTRSDASVPCCGDRSALDRRVPGFLVPTGAHPLSTVATAPGGPRPRAACVPAQPTASRAGSCSRGTRSPGVTGPGGVPSPKGRPPSSSRKCGVAQPVRSGPRGTMPVGLMSVWTS